MMRVMKPAMIKSEHIISMAIISISVTSGSIPNSDGNIALAASKLYSCRMPNCIIIMPTNRRRNRRPMLVYEYPVVRIYIFFKEFIIISCLNLI